MAERQRNGKFSQNNKFGQNGKFGHSCVRERANFMTPGQKSCYCTFRFKCTQLRQ